jgi:hypothetical protein
MFKLPKKEFPLPVERYTDLGDGQVMYVFGTLSEKGYLIPSDELDEETGIPLNEENIYSLSELGIPAETLEAISGKIVAFEHTFKAEAKKYTNKIVRSIESYLVFEDRFYVIVGVEPKIQISAVDPVSSENAGDSGQFLFSLNTPTVRDIRVKFSVTGMAKNGGDYEKLVNYILIPAGNTSGIVEVLPFNDLKQEGTEKVSLKLKSNGVKGYTIGKKTSATVKIFDND